MNLRLLFLPTSASARLWLNLLGLAILAGGLAWAASIWVAQERIEAQSSTSEGSAAGALAPEDTRRYNHDVELYYGQTGLLVDKWTRWWEEWNHGKPLAKAIAVVSLIVAGVLFYAAANSTRLQGLFTPTLPQESPQRKPPAGNDT